MHAGWYCLLNVSNILRQHHQRISWRSQLIRSRTSAQYSYFLERSQLFTQKLFKQGYLSPRLQSSLQKLYGRHRNLVDPYEISISQMTMNLLFFTWMFYFLYHCQDFYRAVYIRVTRRVYNKKQELLTLREHLTSPPVCYRLRIAHPFSFLCCLIMRLYVSKFRLVMSITISA